MSAQGVSNYEASLEKSCWMTFPPKSSFLEFFKCQKLINVFPVWKRMESSNKEKLKRWMLHNIPLVAGWNPDKSTRVVLAGTKKVG